VIPRKLATGLSLALLTTPALAAVLPIDGIFGTEDGCAFFMSGKREGDDIVVLTPDTFTARGRGCYFEELLDGIGDVVSIAATCHADLEEGSTTEIVRVFDDSPNGFTVELVGLGEYGPLFPCPGADILFERGVRI
jgi:hypothetical protein